MVALASPLPAVARTAKPDVLQAALGGTNTPGICGIAIRNLVAGPEIVAGTMRLGKPRKCVPGKRWHVGSNGKAITATLIARLVEQGVLSWDQRLESMLPSLAQSMRSEYRDVTLPDLLSHRSGLPENHDDTSFFGSFHSDTASFTSQRMRYIAKALGDAPVTAKRAISSYSNTGLLIAAAAAEHATGKTFELLMIDEVFRPLKMASVSFDQLGGRDEPSGHVDGRIAGRPIDANPGMFAPAGAMRMSLGDWARFCIDQLQGERAGGRLLRPETYRFLHSGQGNTSSGLGWGIAPSPMGLRGPALTHAGSDGNWFALVALFPMTGSGALVVANAGPSMGGDLAASKAIRSLAATIAEVDDPAQP